MRIIGCGIGIIIFMAILIAVNIQKKEDSNISVLMRIMTNYLQVLAAALAYNLQFPTYVLDLLSSAKQLGNSSGVFLSFDCLLMDTNATKIFDNIAYLKVICIALIPVFLIAVTTVLYRLVFIKNTDKFKRYCCVTTITIIFLLHPSLTQYCLRIFKCVEIGEGNNKVEMDITTDCWSANHLKWVFSLALPMLIFYVFGCPMIALAILFKNRNRLDQPEVLKYIILLYQGLKHEKYYWELVNTLRKCLLLAFHVFIPDKFRIMKALFGVFVLFMVSLLQARLKPFKINIISTLEHREMVSSLLTLYGGLIFAQESKYLPGLSIAFFFVII